MNLSDAQYAALKRRMAGGERIRPQATPHRSEQEEQEAVIDWARIMEGRCPALRWLHHSPNGFARDKAVAVQVKAAGCKAGFPDLVLPVPMGGYHGLFIELKAERGRVRPEQEAWLEYLRSAHYLAVVCYGADAAIRTIETYLQIQG